MQRSLVVSDRGFFITCRVLPGGRILTGWEFASRGGVIHDRREKHGFLLRRFMVEKIQESFRPAASRGTPYRYRNRAQCCDTRRHDRSGNQQRGRRRVF